MKSIKDLDRSKTRIFIAGPMRGYENYNFKKFDHTEELLRQLGFDVEHGSVIPETVEEQATLSLKNLDAIMIAAGTDRTKVMKTTIFLTDMNDFAKVNEVYGAFFGESKPARSCVAVAALPTAAKVEIECIVSLK